MIPTIEIAGGTIAAPIAAGLLPWKPGLGTRIAAWAITGVRPGGASNGLFCTRCLTRRVSA
ncbi:MAG: hypothetical protein IIC10_07705, partial [Proteobacteria bacterium]|nr:hypothetical protein [Pseudomonadota bacterium]